MSLRDTSKFLSLILRHNSQIIGLTLDEHGWADVDDLISRMKTKRPIDRVTLDEIVATDDKQRYSFSANGKLIRANQGHSLPVDVELSELKPPEILYHGTGAKFCRSILSMGLMKKSRLYVHLSSDIDTAEKVGRRHGSPRIFVVDSGKMFNDGFKFFYSVNGVWMTEHVPKNYLSEMTL
ncbi:MAG: RNA 2'-phosphotransferase [Selenomonadaceae bacterium]|nr:RNA 2'-phosphotransferase [Selenomonadaceae bacterium]